MAAAVAIPEGFEVESAPIPEGFEVESASPSIPEGFEIESGPTETIPSSHPDRAEEIVSAGVDELLASSDPGTGELKQFLSKPVDPDAMTPSNQPITPVEMTPIGAGV